MYIIIYHSFIRCLNLNAHHFLRRKCFSKILILQLVEGLRQCLIYCLLGQSPGPPMEEALLVCAVVEVIRWALTGTPQTLSATWSLLVTWHLQPVKSNWLLQLGRTITPRSAHLEVTNLKLRFLVKPLASRHSPKPRTRYNEWELYCPLTQAKSKSNKALCAVWVFYLKTWLMLMYVYFHASTMLWMGKLLIIAVCHNVTYLGGISQMVPLGSLTHLLVLRLQQVTPVYQGSSND